MRYALPARNLIGYASNSVREALTVFNISQGDVMHWSPALEPPNFPQGEYFHTDLRWKWYNLNRTVEIFC